MIGWWEARSARERVLLAVMAGALAVFLFWFAVLAPLRAAGEAAERRYSRAVETDLAVGRILGEMAGLKATAARPASARKPLESVIAETAAGAGLELSRVERDPERGFRIAAPSVAPAVLFAWLEALQRQHGVVATHLTILKNETGGLTVDATLARPDA